MNMPVHVTKWSPRVIPGKRGYWTPARVRQIATEKLEVLRTSRPNKRRYSRESLERAGAFLSFLCDLHGGSGRDFHADRRALARAHPELGTEDQIRLSIEVLEEAGVIVRQHRGAKFRWIPNAPKGGYRRKPILFRFVATINMILAMFRKVAPICNHGDSLGLREGSLKTQEKANVTYGGTTAFIQPGHPKWKGWMVPRMVPGQGIGFVVSC